jgi:thioredoxin reductase (NADPH)
MLVRGESLAATMSRYLVDRIESTPNIEVIVKSAIVDLEGEGTKAGQLSAVRWRGPNGGRPSRRHQPPLPVHRRRAQHRWLTQCDMSSWTITASSAPGPTSRPAIRCCRPAARACSRSATSGPGRSSASAAAIGEGAQAVAAIHAYLAEA